MKNIQHRKMNISNLKSHTTNDPSTVRSQPTTHLLNEKTTAKLAT